MKVYVASSWRNPDLDLVIDSFRGWGYEVYDFRAAASFGWSDIDPDAHEWTQSQFIKALDHPLAKAAHIMDKGAMNDSDACVLVLPSGASSHLEAGWFAGQGKPVVVLLADGNPELAYLLTDKVAVSIADVFVHLEQVRDLIEGGPI